MLSGSAQIDIDTAFLNMADTSQFFRSKSTSDPIKAAMYSAILPGLGQAYNKQIWKVPIIYGGAIAFFHFIRYNDDLYNQFRTAEIAVTDPRLDNGVVNPFEEAAPGRFQARAIGRNRERFRRNRDFLIILGVAAYLINIAEAHIAAHLKEFDLNEALSMQLRPSIQPTPLFSRSTISHASGMALVITF